jgi:hypothetical protein
LRSIFAGYFSRQYSKELRLKSLGFRSLKFGKFQLVSEQNEAVCTPLAPVFHGRLLVPHAQSVTGTWPGCTRIGPRRIRTKLFPSTLPSFTHALLHACSMLLSAIFHGSLTSGLIGFVDSTSRLILPRRQIAQALGVSIMTPDPKSRTPLLSTAIITRPLGFRFFV